MLSHAVLPPSHQKMFYNNGKRLRAIPSLLGNVVIFIILLL